MTFTGSSFSNVQQVMLFYVVCQCKHNIVLSFFSDWKQAIWQHPFGLWELEIGIFHSHLTYLTYCNINPMNHFTVYLGWVFCSLFYCHSCCCTAHLKTLLKLLPSHVHMVFYKPNHAISCCASLGYAGREITVVVPQALLCWCMCWGPNLQPKNQLCT